MSVGELINLYRDGEIRIQPEYQRLFRWDQTRKTRFIESILLGLPLPPIFVYQDADGVWELIDGLQRLSTIFEFVGVLRATDGRIRPASALEGTRYLPDLVDKRWDPAGEDGADGIGGAQQLQIKRARMRVEILKQESDPRAKYELFQRLNTGGENLSEQEIRNCVGVMLNQPFQHWMTQLAEIPDFRATINQTEAAIERQMHVELALRFLAFRHVAYGPGMDVHEYLDDALFKLATREDFDREEEGDIFARTFRLLNVAMGENAFKRWDGAGFSGKFLMSVFEVVALGASRNLDVIEQLDDARRNEIVRDKCQRLWQEPVFNRYSGAGVRGTSRLSNLLPMAAGYFRP
ncbi:hypothetical protein BLA18109_03126 [Burkholderia lata]|uniref:GmrSD restriction endonucleases N-terminal domain-containing protein n=2 Tax=Burkholderia lata (strain ATCC 17760 / DSM 23089 / LMG 22485 / NCIMB 9086 / R18194 / 383) TaxID=482957 RepID=A0A6P2VG85_BURL3|nr:hypothetical protein BLA18109_03126 [Burkholderia lata]